MTETPITILLAIWRARLKELQDRCPSSCHGEIDALKECIEDLQLIVEDAAYVDD